MARIATQPVQPVTGEIRRETIGRPVRTVKVHWQRRVTAASVILYPK